MFCKRREGIQTLIPSLASPFTNLGHQELSILQWWPRCFVPWQISVSGMSRKFLWATVTWSTKSPVAMPALLMASSMGSHCEKRDQGDLQRYPWASCEMLYLVCSLTDFVVRMLPTNSLAASFDANRMFHMALLHLANTLAVILRLLRASFNVSLLTPINL